MNFLQTTFVGTLRDVHSFLTFFHLRSSRCDFTVFPDVSRNSQRTRFAPRGDAKTGTRELLEKAKLFSDELFYSEASSDQCWLKRFKTFNRFIFESLGKSQLNSFFGSCCWFPTVFTVAV